MMKTALIAGFAAAGLLFAGAANASLDLATKSQCMLCHDIAQKKVGPAYKEVAAKYKGDKTAEARLFEKVKKGGSGAWGQVPMPPNTAVKDEDIKTLVKWVLAQ